MGAAFNDRRRPVDPTASRPRLAAAMRIVMSLAFALCVSVGASACGGGSASVANPDLRVAISFLPTAADASYTFEFADWGPIEQRLGYSPGSLTSTQADDAFSKKLEQLSGGSPGGNTTYDLQLAGTGDVWSIADVLWDSEEFSIGRGAGGPLAITAFRNGSVISHVEAHLAKCGFRSRRVGGMTLYTGAALKCVSPTGTGIPAEFNAYAFDTADRLVLQSTSPAAVTAAIANRQHGGSSGVLSSILSSLGDVTQVAVAAGPQWCTELSNPAILAGRNATPSKLTRAEHVFADATPYLGFGFGYRYAAGGISGRLAFVYSSDAVARSDLNRREQMLRNGTAFSINEPYSKLFLVRSGQTQGRVAIYQLARPGSSTLRLGTAFDQLDIGFARC